MLGQWEQQGNVFISPGSMIVNSGSLCRDQFIGGFRPVCFCDIPEGDLQRHTTVYGRFGLAFQKGYLVAKGANPVFYVAKGSVACHERPLIPPLTVEELAIDARAALQKYFAALSAAEVPVQRCEFFDRLVASLMRVLPPPWPAGAPGDAHDPTRDVQRQVLVGSSSPCLRVYEILRRVSAGRGCRQLLHGTRVACCGIRAIRARRSCASLCGPWFSGQSQTQLSRA